MKKILKNYDKKSILGVSVAIVVLVVLIIAAFNIYKSNSDINNQENVRNNTVVEGKKDASNNKNIKIQVVNRDGSVQNYCVSTDKAVLGEVIKEVTGLAVEGDITATGLFVKSINGIYADYAVDQTYWALYVNDQYGQVGIDSQSVNDGDVYKFVHEGGYVPQY